MKFTTTVLAGLLQPLSAVTAPRQGVDRSGVIPGILDNLSTNDAGISRSSSKEQHRRSFQILVDGKNKINRSRYNNNNNNGRLFRSRRLHNQKRALTLRNINALSSATTTSQRLCDPSTANPDVGILSCGMGSICKASSENSILRGICVDVVAAQRTSSRSSKTEGNKEELFAAPRSTGILRNHDPRHEMSPKECDPEASTAPDVGVLVCGGGGGHGKHHCIPNAASSLGGYCEELQSNNDKAADASHRELNAWWTTKGAGICDPHHKHYMSYDCDCSGYDNVTGTGRVPCTAEDYCWGFAYPGCKDLCVQQYLVFHLDNFTIPSYYKCLSTLPGAPTPQGFCFFNSFENNSDTCEMRFNTQLCSSCTVTQVPYTSDYADVTYNGEIYFDCRNVDGGSYGSANSVISLLPIVKECYEPLESPIPQCNLCPGENTAIDFLNSNILDRTRLADVDGYGSFTCWDLAYYAYVYSTIPEDACKAAVVGVDSNNCCSSVCEICGEGVPLDVYAIASFAEFGEVPCYYLMAILSEPSECAEAKPLLVGECCGRPTGSSTSTSGPNPSDNLTEAESLRPSTAVDSDVATAGLASDKATTHPSNTINDDRLSDANEDGASRVVLARWSVVWLIGSAGALLMTSLIR